MGIVDIIVFVGFIAAVLFVGLYKSKGEDTHGEQGASDYFLAGRGLTWWLIGFSLIAANISAEQFVGMSGQGAGLYGLSVSSWEWIAAITLVVVAFVLLPYFLRSGITTIPEFLEIRYNHWARLLMTVSMMLILIGVSLIGVIYAGALTLKQLMFEFDVNLSLAGCCWALGAMAAIYVAVGGLKACAWADLLQGSALIIGGGVITYFAFNALSATDLGQMVSATGTAAAIDQGAGVIEKFNELNSSAMHMGSNPTMPWLILLLGIWIPNFYYWGLNQYITQRILGSASLAEGQKGLVLAGFLKLIVPFVIVIPGIIAFNLYHNEMEENAGDHLAVYEQAAANPAAAVQVFQMDPRWENAHPAKAAEITAYNTAVTARVGADAVETVELNQYKYDSALGLLITRLIPKNKGILGFVIAALLGAIVSSLAAVLNAASTLLTMDVYQRYIDRKASQFKLVTMGRVFIGVFVVIGCVVSPLLANNSSVFEFIQKFQGYVSTGILAVFIYGLIFRRSARWIGVVGLCANPVFYHVLVSEWLFPEKHFLYSMSWSLLAVLALMWVLGLIFRGEKVEFSHNTTMDLTCSKGALIFGLIVCVMTVSLYVIFW
ncbi:sodium:solute symporter family transporter [Tichowtungia aerotolerans]|uniref:Sodium/solute symporter n=1 Tax=Tichowtungia aerotolerans TaxID=2697043 RepID=A0A6P1MB63_9BACT|nr:sodium/solute symporter [Tichowtungia aerotolerans]QHI70343.1 sodium/solute symporter [Tichowtungia aerotolerans]